MSFAIDDLDPAGTLAAAEATVLRRRAAEVEDLLLVAHWADLHAADPTKAPGGHRNWDCRGDRLVQLGGEGTPLVQELCLPELAIARGVHLLTVRAAVADVLDLRHRLPRTWAVVAALRGEQWLARRIAVMSRGLSPTAARVVDDAVADALAGEAPARLLAIAEGKVIEADPTAHAARVEAERRRRYVGLSRTDEQGLRQVIARVEAGDAAWVDAMVDRVADILASRPDLHPDCPDAGKDERRSIAFGWLARPAELLTLLLEAQQDRPDDSPDDSPEDGSAARATALSDHALELLTSTDLSRLRPKAVLYVHLHEAALTGTPGVARVEGLGPHSLEQLGRLLGHTEVSVRPVIDLHDRISVNSYEHPEAVKERLHLITPGEAFPHASRCSRGVDIDHPVPFEPHGPPGQTGDHNAAPLSRSHHRAKTHLGYRVTQLGPGEYLWRTPQGLHRLVDARGTHWIDASEAAALTGDDPVDRSLARLLHRHRTGQLTGQLTG